MGWICPDCSSENAFPHTCCEACGRKVSAAFLLEEKNADRREHRLIGDNAAALTVLLNKQMKSIRISALALRISSFLLVAILLLYHVPAICTFAESPRLISTEVQEYLDDRLAGIGHSAQSGLEISVRTAPEKLVSGMKQSQESVLENRLPNLELNSYWAGAFLRSGVHIYRYDKYLVSQLEKYALRVYQKMQWIPGQAERAIEAVQSFSLEGIFHRD